MDRMFDILIFVAMAQTARPYLMGLLPSRFDGSK